MRISRITLAALLSAASLWGQTFVNPTFIPTPFEPATLAVADINGDGYPDIVYSNHLEKAATAKVLLGQADGSFKAGTDIATSAQLGDYCLLQDVTGDKIPDLLCASAAGQSAFGIAKGNGDGTFGAFQLISVPPPASLTSSTPYVLAVGDINGDGNIDIVVGDGHAGLWAMVSNGNGGYAAQAISYSGTAPGQDYGDAQLIDLNKDGKLDLVVQDAASNQLFVYLGQGNGTFGTPSIYTNTGAFILHDVDGDGIPDLIGGNPGAPQVLHGNGDGTFSTTSLATFSLPASDTVPDSNLTAKSAAYLEYFYPIAYADMNNDGMPDILARAGDGLTVMLGASGHQFGPPQHFAAGQALGGPYYRASEAYVDKAGKLDFAAIGPGGIYISYGTGKGTFSTAPSYTSGKLVGMGAVADFNGDGKADVLTNGDEQLQLNLGKGDGTFAAAAPVGPALNDGDPYSGANYGYEDVYSTPPAVGDFNGDGKLDVIEWKQTAAGSSQFSPVLLPGNGNGTFGTPLPAPAKPVGPNYIGKLFGSTADGFAEVIPPQGTTTTSSLNIYLGQAGGSFTPVVLSQFQNTADYIADATVGAWTPGDPTVGLAVGINTSAGSKIAFLTGTASSVKETDVAVPDAFEQVPGVFTPNIMVAGDFDGDGKTDLAYYSAVSQNGVNNFSEHICVLYNNGFPSAQPTITCVAPPTGDQIQQLIAKDVNGDGITDLVMVLESQFDQQAVIWYGTKTRGFSNPQFVIPGEGLVGVSIADLNGDKLPDILGANYLTNSFTVSLQSAAPTLTATYTLVADKEPSTVGQAFNIVATLKPQGTDTTPLTGQVTFFVDGTQVGQPATLANDVASIAGPTNLTAGTHKLTATWPGMTGSPAYAALQMTGTHVVSTSTTAATVTLSFNPNPVQAGVAGTLTAKVSATDTAPLTGTLAVVDSVTGQTVATFTGSGGTKQLTFTALGAHVLTGTYTGDSTHANGVGSTTVQVVLNPPGGPAATSTTLSAGSSTVIVGQSIPLTVKVSGTGTPTGTVQILNNGQPAAPVVSLSNGTATVSIPTSVPGTDQFTAVYSGDAADAASTSTALTVQVVASTFTITPPADITIRSGHHTTESVTLNSTTFSGTVKVYVNNPIPAWLYIRFHPQPMVSLTPGSQATLSMYLDTDSVLGFYSQNRPEAVPGTGSGWQTTGRVLAVLLLLSPAAFARSRKRLRGATLLAWAMLAIALPVLSGCGAGILPKAVAPGNYTITIRGVGSNGEAETASFQLHVTP